MFSGFKRLWNDERGTSFEGIALSVSIIAVAFVASADMLDYVTKPRGNPDIVTTPGHPKATSIAAGGNLDDTPTASLPKLITRSVLDPCTGTMK